MARGMPIEPYVTNDNGKWEINSDFWKQHSDVSDRAASGAALQAALAFFTDALDNAERLLSDALAEQGRLMLAVQRRQSSRMLAAARTEIEAMHPSVRTGTLAEGVVIIATALDAYTSTSETAAELSAIVKAHQELRTTLALLRRASDDVKGAASSEDDGATLSTPLRDAAHGDAPDVGAPAG